MEVEFEARHSLQIRSLITQLPIEILENILVHLSTKKLMEARFVSRPFKIAATPICRRRHVQLNLRKLVYDDIPHIKNLYATFGDLNNVPWSSVKLILFTDTNLRSGHIEDSLTPVQIQKFIRTFGVLLRQIQIGGDNAERILEILRGTPNVVTVVRIREDEEENEVPQLVMPINAQLQLPKLKLLIFHINTLTDDINFIRILVKSGGNCLMELQLIFHRFVTSTEEDIGVLAELIAPLPSISLKFNHVANSDHSIFAFSGKHLKITELDLKLAPPEDWTTNVEFVAFCERFGSFLTSISEHLQKFILHKLSHRLQLPASHWKMPVLPALKSLELYLPPICSRRNYWNGERIFPTLTPFEPDQFPNLEVVKLKNWVGESGKFTATAQFNTVRELRVGHSLNPDTIDVRSTSVRKWHSSFPNLKLFEGFASFDDFNFIMCNMTGLEHLDLTLVLDSGSVTKGDVNASLTGIPDADSVFRKSKKYKTEKAVDDFVSEEKRIFPGRPSLLTMTNLKALVLKGQPSIRCFTVRDSGACLSLMKIQPLEYLGLENLEISEEVEAKLRSYHRQFEKVMKEVQGVNDVEEDSDSSDSY